MKKSTYILSFFMVVILIVSSCTQQPSPQPSTPTTPSNPSTPAATLTDTANSLTGTWYWDSAVNYNAGVRSLIAVAPAAGGPTGITLDQQVNLTHTPYNGLGTGSAIDINNKGEAFHKLGTGTNMLYGWYIARGTHLTVLNAPGYMQGNIYTLTTNRLIVTNYSGSGTINGMFYYWHK